MLKTIKIINLKFSLIFNKMKTMNKITIIKIIIISIILMNISEKTKIQNLLSKKKIIKSKINNQIKRKMNKMIPNLITNQ